MFSPKNLKIANKEIFKKVSRKNIRVALFVSALVICGLMLPSRFALTLTPSTPYRLFFIAGKPDRIENGGYVLFEKDLTEIGGKTQEKIIKRVVCAEGSVLQHQGRDYYCNGEWLGHAKERSRDGKPTVPFVYDGKIPPGKLFVMGTHTDSYDSRYFGFVDTKEAVRAIVYPLL